MLPLTRSYTTVPAQDISARVVQTVPEFPTIVSDLIGRYAQTDFSGALKPLSPTDNDAELNQAIKEAFASPECDPQLKVDIIYSAYNHRCQDKLRCLIAELLESGQDVYLNNTSFDVYGFRLGWLFFREDLTGKGTLPPGPYGKVHFSGARLSFVNLDLAYLPRAIFKRAVFDNTELRGTVLYEADFSDSEVEGVDFQQLTGPVKIYLDRWHAFSKTIPVSTILSYATFAGSNIARSKFSGAIMSKTNLIGTRNIHLAKFDETDLRTISVYDPESPIPGGTSQDALWTQIYIRIHNALPSATDLKEFRQTFASCDTNQLLVVAHKIGEMGDVIQDFVAFSKRPGGDNYQRNIWLISMGIMPDELYAYNQFRGEGRDRMDVIKLIKESRKQT